MTGSKAEQFQRLLIDACAGISGRTALLLSGGLDSGVVFAAMLRAGLTFDVFTITFGDYPTPDSRLAERRAQTLAPHLPFEVLAVPRDEQMAEGVVRWYVSEVGATQKAPIEVMVMTKWALDALLERGYTTFVQTMSSGVLWGVTKEPLMERSRTGDEGWTKMRRSDFNWEFKGYPPGASRIARRYVQRLGAAWLDPMANAAVADFMLACSYNELNRPKPKSLAVAAFPELLHTPSHMGGMQMVGGVREFMTYAANQRGYSTAMRWYNAICREMGHMPKGSAAAKANWSGIDEHSR